MRNFAYSSIDKYNEQYMFNENIELYSIKTDDLNNTYLQSKSDKKMLLENIDVLNPFFMVDYFDKELNYYPFIIVSEKIIYFYVVNNEMEIMYNYKYEYNDNIIDNNYCCRYMDDTRNIFTYFYIISENKMYIYISEGSEIEIIDVENNLINASIYLRYNTENDSISLNIDLIYSGLEDKVIEII